MFGCSAICVECFLKGDHKKHDYGKDRRTCIFSSYLIELLGLLLPSDRICHSSFMGMGPTNVFISLAWFQCLIIMLG